MTEPEGEALEEYEPKAGALATFWRQASEGTFYWRLLVPARRLPGAVRQVRYSDTMHPDPLHRQQGRTAVWQFLGDLERTRFAARVQAAGIRSLMEVDDNYLIPAPPVPGLRGGWGNTFKDGWTNQTGYSHANHREIVKGVDGVIVSTVPLAERYAHATTAPIYHCPNSVDPDDWEYVPERDRPLTVGYAGSDSHKYDLHLVDRALSWCADQRVPLVKLGAGSKTWRWPHESMPWTDDLAQYRRNLQAVDVGLCPVKRGDWHDCKSDVKAMEYLMAGALPIVQADSPCYRDWVGRVPSAATEKQWERAVRDTVRMPREEREAMREEALAWLHANKTIDVHIAGWRKAVNG